jgi:hypothetical protein
LRVGKPLDDLLCPCEVLLVAMSLDADTRSLTRRHGGIYLWTARPNRISFIMIILWKRMRLWCFDCREGLFHLVFPSRDLPTGKCCTTYDRDANRVETW